MSKTRRNNKAMQVCYPFEVDMSALIPNGSQVPVLPHMGAFLSVAPGDSEAPCYVSAQLSIMEFSGTVGEISLGSSSLHVNFACVSDNDSTCWNPRTHSVAPLEEASCIRMGYTLAESYGIFLLPIAHFERLDAKSLGNAVREYGLILDLKPLHQDNSRIAYNGKHVAMMFDSENSTVENGSLPTDFHYQGIVPWQSLEYLLEQECPGHNLLD